MTHNPLPFLSCDTFHLKCLSSSLLPFSSAAVCFRACSKHSWAAAGRSMTFPSKDTNFTSRTLGQISILGFTSICMFTPDNLLVTHTYLIGVCADTRWMPPPSLSLTFSSPLSPFKGVHVFVLNYGQTFFLHRKIRLNQSIWMRETLSSWLWWLQKYSYSTLAEKKLSDGQLQMYMYANIITDISEVLISLSGTYIHQCLSPSP